MTEHRNDSDCTVSPETNCCISCGVEHSDRCGTCGGRGYHAEDCEPTFTGCLNCDHDDAHVYDVRGPDPDDGHTDAAYVCTSPGCECYEPEYCEDCQ